MTVELAEIRDFLAGCVPFGLLAPETLDELPPRLRVRYHRRDEVIIPAGGENTSLYTIRSGAVEVADAGGVLLDRREAGSSFGYSTLARPGPCAYTIRAIEDTLVLVMPGEVFRELAACRPEFGAFFGEQTARIRAAVLASRSGAGGDILRTAVGEIISREIVTGTRDLSIRQAAEVMERNRVSALLIVDGPVAPGSATRAAGIVTDRDLRSKVVAAGLDPSRPVTEIMAQDPHVVTADTLAFEVLLQMIELKVHHLPVCDRGRPLGMVTSSDIMRVVQANPVYLAAEIGRHPTVDGVVGVARRLPRLVEQFAARNASPEDVGRVVTVTADAIARRLLQLAEEELGPPPVPYCYVAFGSQARYELGPGSDQDSGLILDDAATPEHDTYFAELAARVRDGLAASGFPVCPGDVMAATPRWRRPLREWRGYFRTWMLEPDGAALLNAQIFFDLRPIHGEWALADGLFAEITEVAAEAPRFLAHLAKLATFREPPLGFFRGFVLEKHGEYARTLNLKAGGLAAIVQLGRLHALAGGVGQVATRSRLRAAAAAGALSEQGAEELIGAFDVLGEIRLAHQARQIEAGEQVDYHLDPDTLTALERHSLRAAFHVIGKMQAGLRLRFPIQHMS